MNRDDDQQLWDLLGKAASPKVSGFFSRNVLRHVRQEPVLLRGSSRWLNWKILVPATALAAVLAVSVAMFMRTTPSASDEVAKSEPAASLPIAQAPQPEVKAKSEPVIAALPKAQAAPEAKTVPADPAKKNAAVVAKADPSTTDLGILETIEEQDYDAISNLDDLLVLYETSLWDENSSL